ncbi:MAG: hypothetical protein B6I25_05225 [Planctomycetales bacterium 4572_13]|nr:MAG: hypothetical protein B6I25_05225 [Planctomycetales bacterium 4572_13]
MKLRAGKTYYLYQLMDLLRAEKVERQQILYINFEDERLEFENGRYDDIIESYLELYPDTKLSELYIFFDEIQELPSWEKYIRRIYDTTTKHIFLTGSNSRFLSREIATSLRGRTIAFELMPLSFSEYLKFNKIDAADTYSTRGKSRIQKAFDQYLIWGGYPELVKIDAELKTQILQEYFNVMIYRDLVERYTIGDVSLLKYVMKRLISSLTKEFSINKIYNELKSRGLSISKDSLYKLVDEIFSVYLMESVEKYEPSLVNREMSNKKIYMYDNGLAAATRYAIFEDKGKLLENMVFNHLRKKYDQVSFYKNRYECDFLAFKQDSAPVAIQVTQILSQDTIDREIKGLDAVHKIRPDSKLLILFTSIQPNLTVSEKYESMSVIEWLLTS